MRLVHYLLLTAFHLLVFSSWCRGDEPARFEVVNKMAPAFTVVSRLPAATPAPAAPAHPEGFRDNWPGVGIVEYRGGAWRVVPPAPSQYAAPAVAAPRPFTAPAPYTIPATTARFAGAPSTFSPAPAPFAARTPTPALRVIAGGTESSGCSSYG